MINKKEKIKKITKGIIFSIIPLIACMIYAGLQGTVIWKINPFGVQIPQWCDEVYYYLQIESMVETGNPAGYMGYNESFAQIGNLGAWSVFAMRPYVMLGKIFGITPMNMIYFNITFVVISFAVFYNLVRPDNKEILKIAIMYLAVPLFSRYVLSGMTEPLYFSGVVVIAGFAIYFQKGKYTLKEILACYLVIVYLSLSRPYMLAFLLVPVCFHLKKNWKECLVTFAVVFGAFAVIYLLYVQPRLANYYMTVIDYSLFSVLKTQGIWEFIISACKTFVSDSMFLISYFRNNTIEVMVPYQIVIFLLCAVMSVAIFRIAKKRSIKDNIFIVSVVASIITISIIAAMILLYVEYTSARHMIIVALFLMFIVAMYVKPPNKIWHMIFVSAFLVLGWYNTDDLDMVYRLSTSEDEFGTTPVPEDAKALKVSFEVLQDAEAWENTVAYEYCVDNMNYCYYLPKNAGVNICIPEYIAENYEDIQCRYLMTPVDEERAQLYAEAGWEILLEGEKFILYERNE